MHLISFLDENNLLKRFNHWISFNKNGFSWKPLEKCFFRGFTYIHHVCYACSIIHIRSTSQLFRPFYVEFYLHYSYSYSKLSSTARNVLELAQQLTKSKWWNCIKESTRTVERQWDVTAHAFIEHKCVKCLPDNFYLLFHFVRMYTFNAHFSIFVEMCVFFHVRWWHLMWFDYFWVSLQPAFHLFLSFSLLVLMVGCCLFFSWFTDAFNYIQKAYRIIRNCRWSKEMHSNCILFRE